MGCHNSVPANYTNGVNFTQSNQKIRQNQDNNKLKPHLNFNDFDFNDNQYFTHILTHHINEYTNNSDQLKNLVSHDVYKPVIELFCKYFLTRSKKIQLLELVKEYMKVNFRIQKHNDQKLFCQQISEKLNQLKERIKEKNSQSLCYWTNTMQKYPRGMLYQCKHDLSEEETIKIAQKTRVYCNKDLNSFAFITLYLQDALKKFIKGNNLTDSQQILLKTLRNLQKKYPANEQDEQNSKITYQNLESFSNEKPYEKFTFTSEKKSHYEQLTDFIILKATQAKSDQVLFKQMVKDCCSQFGGYSLKTGLKIKSKQNKASIFRTVQKLVDKKIYQKRFLEEKQNYKNEVISRSKAQVIDLDQIVQNEMAVVKKRIQKILQQQKQIEFDAKDLLRGKCIFDKIQEIVHTAKKLLKILQEKGLKVLQIKNRLMKKTKDITLIIEFPHAIAQLQLVLKLDSVANEFNHKIYELLRSTLYSPITNLFVLGKKWGQTFFGQMLQNYEYMHTVNKDQKFFDGHDNLGFKSFQKEVKQFKKIYQGTNLANSDQAAQSLKQQNQEISVKYGQILRIFQSNNKYLNIDLPKRKNQQVVNNARFAYKILNGDFIIKQINTLTAEQLQDNAEEISQLKGDVLRQMSKYEESIIQYQKVIQIIQKQKKQPTQRIANIYHNLAKSYQFNNSNIKENEIKYQKSIENLNKCLQIKNKLYGTTHLQVAKTLTDIGQIYYFKGDSDKSIKLCKKALQIQEKLTQKQSFQKATTYQLLSHVYFQIHDADKSIYYNQKAANCFNKIGLISGSKQQYQKALTYFKESSVNMQQIGGQYRKKKDYKKAMTAYMKCLQIRQKIVGKIDITSAAIFSDIAALYQDMDQHQHAIEYYEKSIIFYKEYYGQDSMAISLNYQSLSKSYQYIGQLDRAEDYALRAYQNRKKKIGQKSQYTKQSLQQLTSIRRKIQQKKYKGISYQGNQPKTCEC